MQITIWQDRHITNAFYKIGISYANYNDAMQIVRNQRELANMQNTTQRINVSVQAVIFESYRQFTTFYDLGLTLG